MIAVTSVTTNAPSSARVEYWNGCLVHGPSEGHHLMEGQPHIDPKTTDSALDQEQTACVSCFIQPKFGSRT